MKDHDPLLRFWPSDVLYAVFAGHFIFEYAISNCFLVLLLISLAVHSSFIYIAFSKEHKNSPTNFFSEIICVIGCVFMSFFYFLCSAPYFIITRRIPYAFYKAYLILKKIYLWLLSPTNNDNSLVLDKNPSSKALAFFNNRTSKRKPIVRNIGRIMCPFCKTFLILPENSEGKPALCLNCKNRFCIPDKFPHPLVQAKKSKRKKPK